MATSVMNLADPQLELIDPTPNIQTLFIHFDEIFFWTKLASRAVVRWSKRMYSCAGICSYEGRGGLCDIALSEPLLKLRPRKDLVETLLHEMIHAFLFVTNRDQDRDGHGPNFKAHMHRINKSAGLNISIYHEFHDEVKLYQTHWWRCDGPCQSLKPHFGVVRRTVNRAPGPSDSWWKDHSRKCGGTFIKIKEPEGKPTKQKTTKTKVQKNVTTKSNADITKFVTNIVNTISSATDMLTDCNCVERDSKKTPSTKSKLNSTGMNLVNKKGVDNPTGLNNKHKTDSRNVTEQVRNIWANKQIPTVSNKIPIKNLDTSNLFNKMNGTSKPTKHKIETTDNFNPPAKMKKIKVDDYFKANASTMLKDLYGEDYELKKSRNSTKLSAVTIKKELAECPVCNKKIESTEMNQHLDECLNKEAIEEINHINNNEVKSQMELNNNDLYQDDYYAVGALNVVNKDKSKRKTDLPPNLQSVDNNRVNNKEYNNINRNPTVSNVRKSDNFVSRHNDNEIPKIKIEPDEVIIKSEPGAETYENRCPCCGKKLKKTIEEHLDECIAFVNDEVASTSFNNNSIIVIDDDDDDICDESLTLNATGTKTPCPCCMKMIEAVDMNDHLDICLEIP